MRKEISGKLKRFLVIGAAAGLLAGNVPPQAERLMDGEDRSVLNSEQRRYYLERAQGQMMRAQLARNPAAAQIHLELAECYLELIYCSGTSIVANRPKASRD